MAPPEHPKTTWVWLRAIFEPEVSQAMGTIWEIMWRKVQDFRHKRCWEHLFVHMNTTSAPITHHSPSRCCWALLVTAAVCEESRTSAWGAVTVIRCCPKVIYLGGEEVAVLFSKHSLWQLGFSGLMPQMSTVAQKLQDGAHASSSCSDHQAGQASFTCCCVCLVVPGSRRSAHTPGGSWTTTLGRCVKYPWSEKCCWAPEQQQNSPHVVAAWQGGQFFLWC